jgi:hypothetical protein
MKKRLTLLILIIVFIISGVIFFNLETITRVGVDYKVQTIKIPLYLKILNFYDRHFNYQWMTGRIIEGLDNDEDKVVRLLNWTFNHIKQQPESLPVMDEHVWSVIVRGYGVDDNFNDVFTTLCNYADVDAYFIYIKNKKSVPNRSISLVRIKGKWTVFDPYNGVYFRNSSGSIASIQDMKAGNMTIIRLLENYRIETDYLTLPELLPDAVELKLTRANAQSPVNRVLLQIERMWNRRILIE